MIAADSRFLLFGTRENEPESRKLNAGPLRVILQDGNLRMLCFMGHEVLRAVSFQVRDKDWGTCAAAISNLHIRDEDKQFSIHYEALYTAQSGARLDCTMTISGSSSGKIEFSAVYSADADFETARTGFTVLHPLSGVAGRHVTVHHGDGSVEHSHWPDLIEPWQPFKDITAITHTVADGIQAETRFEGDVFEMEDQRNWTDTSYKTYVRPLALPWPYMVTMGETFRQSVTVDIRAAETASAKPSPAGLNRLTISRTHIILPEIGIGLRPECREQELAAVDTLRQTGARHLIAHFDPLAGHGPEALRGYAEIAVKSGLKMTLELALPCVKPVDEELANIAALVSQAELQLDTLFVSPSVDRQSTPPGSQWPDCPPLADIYAAARKAFPNIRLGGGMLSYFTEINRKRIPGDRVDYVSHATCPIVHAADDLSVMQTFEALRYVVRSARAIYGDKPYRIGPSTIAMRQNPYGSKTKENPALSRIAMANVDPRHSSQFGAAWTLAYAATTASASLEVLTLSTLTGPFGLIAVKDEPSAEGNLRPLASVVAALGALSGQTYLAVETSNPSAILGLAASNNDGRTTLLLANITPRSQMMELDILPVTVEMLDIVRYGEGGFRDTSATKQLSLGPYACSRITF